MLELLIEERFSSGGSIVAIMGRNAGCRLRVDDIFTAISVSEPASSPLDYGKPSVWHHRGEVDLKVTMIKIYGHYVSELDPGRTGIVMLAGTGRMLLAPGMRLTGETQDDRDT